MPTANRQPRKRKAKAKTAADYPANGFISIQLHPAEFDALDALDASGILGFPRQKPRSEKIRWLIRNFGKCHARLQHAQCCATDNADRLAELRRAVSPLSTVMQTLTAAPDSFDASPVDDGDLQFYD